MRLMVAWPTLPPVVVLEIHVCTDLATSGHGKRWTAGGTSRIGLLHRTSIGAPGSGWMAQFDDDKEPGCSGATPAGALR